MQPCIVIIDDQAEAIVADGNEAICTDMTVLRHIHHKLVEHLMELLRVIAHLDKPAFGQIHSGIFPPHGFILATGAICLHKGRLNLQRIHKGLGLGLAVHIIAVDDVHLCGVDDQTAGVHDVDFLDAIFFGQVKHRQGRFFFVFLLHLMGDMKQLCIRFSLDVRLHIIDGGGEHLLGFVLHNVVLQDEGECARNQIGDHDAGQQPALEGLGDPLVLLFAADPFAAQEGNDDNGCADSCGIAQNHRDRSALDKLKGVGSVIHIGDENQDHVDYFAYDGNADAVAPGGLLVVEHQLAQARCHETGKDGGNAAGKLRIFTAAPVHREPAVQAADQTGNDTGRCAENQAC